MAVMIYDIETKYLVDEVEGGWENPHGMRVGTCVIYNVGVDLYHFFGPESEEQIEETLSGTTVVSFNGVNFDNRVILGNEYKAPWKDVDLFQLCLLTRFGVTTVKEAIAVAGSSQKVLNGSLSLGNIAVKTLGVKKTGSGALAPKLIKAERWADVYQYNLQDVRLTYKLFIFLKENGYLIDGHGKRLEIRKKLLEIRNRVN